MQRVTEHLLFSVSFFSLYVFISFLLSLLFFLPFLFFLVAAIKCQKHHFFESKHGCLMLGPFI